MIKKTFHVVSVPTLLTLLGVMVSCSKGSDTDRSIDKSSLVKDFGHLNEVKTCQTAKEIRDHIAIKTTSGIVIDGQVVSDINQHFCIHTILDNSSNLATGAILNPIDQPMLGLLIAIADVELHDNGVSFHEAQMACAALTIGGKSPGSWKAPASGQQVAWPREEVPSRSAENLVRYSADWAIRPIAFLYSAWTSSFAGEYYSNDAWSMTGLDGFDSSLGVVTPHSTPQESGVRCIANP